MHQDYIMRMIQQMTTFITRVLRLRKEEEYEEALIEIGQAYGRLTGIPASLVHGLDEDHLIVMISTTATPSADQCIALAALLREEALTYEEMDDFDEAYPRFTKSIRLYFEALQSEPSLSREDVPGLDDSVRRISGHDVSPKLRSKLIPYLEQTGQLDLAENALAAWVDESEKDEEAVQSIQAFYRRVLRFDDAELMIGGLTRSEIEQSLQSL